MKVKKSDLVKLTDGSYVLELSGNGDLLESVGIGSSDITWTVVDTGLKLSTPNGEIFGDIKHNDTILISENKKQTIFVMSDQLSVVHTCNICPNCGGKY